MVKVQWFESCEIYSREFESCRRNPNKKPTVNSTVHHSKVSKWALRNNSWRRKLWAHMITASFKRKFLIQYKDESFSGLAGIQGALQYMWTVWAMNPRPQHYALPTNLWLAATKSQFKSVWIFH